MITVIIPVYNTKQYLTKCLDSVLSQTYANLEILIVNDGSTDGSEELLNSLSKKDSRIKVINQKNQGVCVARNVGIENATGEYISFVDSDDTLEPDMYETLINIAHKYDVDIAHCSYNRITDGVVKQIGNSESIYIHDTTQGLKCLLNGKHFTGSCWTKIYARRLFDSTRFPLGITTSEDMLINFELFSKVDKSAFFDVCKYNYMTSSTSSCIHTSQTKRSRDLLYVNREILRKNHIPELTPIIQKRILNSLFYYYKSLVYDPIPNESLQGEIINQISAMHQQGYRFSRRRALEYKALRHTPKLYKLAYRIYDQIRIPNYDV